MTDRLKGFVVTLQRDIRDDDAQPIIDAIKMIKGVLDVEPSISDIDDQMNRSVVKQELREKLWKALE